MGEKQRKNRLGLLPRSMKAYGAIIRRIAAGRKQTLSDVAVQLGMDYQELWKIVDGLRPPNAEMAERILRWATENLSWEKHPTAPIQMWKSPRRGRKVSFRCNEHLMEKIEIICGELGLSHDALVRIAVERLVKHDNVIKSLKDAIEAVEKSWVQQLFEEVPAMAELFDIDENWAITRVGKGPKQRRQVDVVKAKLHEPPFAMQKLLEKDIHDNGAVSTKVTMPTWKETDEL